MVDQRTASLQAQLLPFTLTINNLQHILSSVSANIYANHVQSPANVLYRTPMKSVLNEDIKFTGAKEEAQ